MRLLLDTHVAVWSISSSQRLPAAIVELLADAENEIFVSIVSLWEIALKNSSAARDPMPFSAAVGAFRFVEFGYDSLQLLPTHVLRFENLPLYHRDPFDRMLTAQALVEGLRLVTHDVHMSKYADDVIVF